MWPAGLTHFRQAAAKKRKVVFTEICNLRPVKAVFENSDPFIGFVPSSSSGLLFVTGRMKVLAMCLGDTLLFKSRNSDTTS